MFAAAASGIGMLAVAGALAVPSGAAQRRPAVEKALIALPRGAHLLGQRLLPGGEAVVSYRYDGVVLTVAAPRGSTSRVSVLRWSNGQDGTATASATMPDQKGSSGSSASDVTPAEVYADAIAAGMPKADAVQMRTRAERAVSTAARVLADAVSPNVILQSPTCAKVSINPGNNGESCDLPEIIQEKGADWWIGDQITTSGHYNSTFEGLERVAGRDNYTAHNQIDAWRPSGTSGTNCNGSTTVSLSYAGAGLSSSVDACGGSIGPISAAPTTGQGAYWGGCSGNTEGAPEVDGLYSPSDASDSYTQYVSMSWGVCYT